MTFFAVIGKNAPAFTVASFAISMKVRSQTFASPERFRLKARHPTPRTFRRRRKFESKNANRINQLGDAFARGETALFYAATRWLLRRRPGELFLFILNFVSKSTMRRAFFSNSGDFEFTLVSAPKQTRDDLTR